MPPPHQKGPSAIERKKFAKIGYYPMDNFGGSETSITFGLNRICWVPLSIFMGFTWFYLNCRRNDYNE